MSNIKHFVYSTFITIIGCSGGSPTAAPRDASDVVTESPGVIDVSSALCRAAPVSPLAFARDLRVRPMDGELRVNHLQAKATHNSYHVRPANDLPDWAYSHRPLAEQLDLQGVRGVELDLQWDDECQRFRVFHFPIVDARSTCDLLTECLVELRGWSSSHPGHHPIFVHLEPKFGSSPATDEARMTEVEREVLSVLSREWIITPDEVKGSRPSLRQAITEGGWPTLGATRGRFLFYVNNTDGLRRTYTHGLRDLDGRLFFAESGTEDPFAAVLVLNDPVTDAEAIARALSMGFLVRTRADSDPRRAMMNDQGQRDRALASGAQIVSTDFPALVSGIPYSVEIPGGTPSRCSPVSAPRVCTSLAIEDPMSLMR